MFVEGRPRSIFPPDTLFTAFIETSTKVSLLFSSRSILVTFESSGHLFHVLHVTHVLQTYSMFSHPGWRDSTISAAPTHKQFKKEKNNEKGGQNEAGHLCKCKPSVGITSSDGTCLCNHARLQVWPTGKLIDVMTDSWFLKPPYQYLKISIKCLRDKFQMFQTFIKSFL